MHALKLAPNQPTGLRGAEALDAERDALQTERAAETEVANRDAELDSLRSTWKANPTTKIVAELAVLEQRAVNAREALVALRAANVPTRQAATRERARRDHAREAARASAARKRFQEKLGDLGALAVRLSDVIAEIDSAVLEQQAAARAANQASGLLPGEGLLPVVPLEEHEVFEARTAALRDAFPSHGFGLGDGVHPANKLANLLRLRPS